MIRQQLLEGISEKLSCYFSPLVHSPQAVEDLVQEVFLVAVKDEKLEEPITYFIGVARNLLKKHYRKKFRQNKLLAEYAKIAPTEHVDAQGVGEVVDRVRDALAQIEPTRVKVLRSLILDGESSREIGKTLKRNHKTVLWTAKKGQEDFKRLIGEDLL